VTGDLGRETDGRALEIASADQGHAGAVGPGPKIESQGAQGPDLEIISIRRARKTRDLARNEMSRRKR